MKTNEVKPKVLLCDIETTPLVSYTWGRYEQDVVGVKQEWYILSMAYKWLDEKKTKIISLDQFIGNKPNTCDTKKFIQSIHKLFNKADIIIAQNGDAFDIKKINTRFIYYGLEPTSPYKTVDTLKVAKSRFAFSSNSLNEMGKFFGLGEKKDTNGFKTWLGCMAGDKKSWTIMKKYNIQDVVLLEKIYKKLAPWMKTYPKIIDAKEDDPARKCDTCGKQMTKNGIRRCVDYAYVRMYCPSCGHWQRGEDVTTEKEVKA